MQSKTYKVCEHTIIYEALSSDEIWVSKLWWRFLAIFSADLAIQTRKILATLNVICEIYPKKSYYLEINVIHKNASFKIYNSFIWNVFEFQLKISNSLKK